MENTDKSLLNAHLRGDTEAFGKLVRRYGDILLGYLIRISGSREQAEDLFQETFKRVHEKAHTLRSNHFKSWLFTIATRVAIDGLRKCRRLPVVSLNQKPNCDDDHSKQLGAVAVAKSHPDPSEKAVKDEQRQQVRQALELLPTKQRATLVLAYYQGLNYRQTAEVLGCSIGTVKTQMYRALKTLAEKLPDISEMVE